MATSSISTLDSYYQNLINYTLTQEKQPITRLTKQKDEINVKKAVYTDLKSKFDTLQTAIKALRSNQGTYGITPGRSVSVSPATSGTTVATATVSSSVSAGTYSLSVTSLAQAHEVHSTRQTYTDQALGLATGSFVIGGAAVRSASIVTALPNTVASISSDGTNTIMPGQKELGTGSYYIETRNDATSGWQFRIVDSEGVAQNVKETGSTEFTANWQSIPTTGETYDTGRGLSVVFGTNSSLFTAANKSTGAVKLDYSAQGASIDVTSTMSLVDINSAINAATYASGNEVISSIIDNTLVLKNQSTGASHVMLAADVTGNALQTLGVLKSSTANDVNTKVTAKNASFSVNGMAMVRSSNTGLTDVVAGMTLNLASDAEGKNANIIVASDMTSARTAINTFVSAFNDLTSYVRSKTTTVKNADETYTRGALVSEQNLRYAANDLIAIMNQDYTNSGIYQNLSQIGITISSDLSATVSDSSKLTTALSTHISDVTKILDAAMESMANTVGTYAGTTGYVNQSLTNANTQVTNLTSRITSMNERISRRQESLVKQYAIIQAQMETLMNQQSLNSTLYG
jgi:flagellar hook-associated protein 2